VRLFLELPDKLPGDKVTWLGFVRRVAGHGNGSRLQPAPQQASACRFGRHKKGDREKPDILDIFNQSPDEVRRASWHDSDRFAPDFNAMSD
jgi:hypothetical protein